MHVLVFSLLFVLLPSSAISFNQLNLFQLRDSALARHRGSRYDVLDFVLPMEGSLVLVSFRDVLLVSDSFLWKAMALRQHLGSCGNRP